MSDTPLEKEFERYAVLLRAMKRANAKMPTELVQAITAIKNAIDGVNIIRKYADEIQDAQRRGELMRAIGELSVELANAQMQLAQQLTANNELAQEVTRLKKENEDLRNPRLEPVYKNGLYYLEKGEEDDGPFCVTCYDTSKQLLRLTKAPQVMWTLGRFKCNKCNAFYTPG